MKKKGSKRKRWKKQNWKKRYFHIYFDANTEQYVWARAPLALFPFSFCFVSVVCVFVHKKLELYCERLIDSVCCWKCALKCVDFSVRYFIWLLFYCDKFICFSLLPLGLLFRSGVVSQRQIALFVFIDKKSFEFYSSNIIYQSLAWHSRKWKKQFIRFKNNENDNAEQNFEWMQYSKNSSICECRKELISKWSIFL